MALEQLTLTDEQIQDIVASLIISGDNADTVYDDTNNTLTISLSDSISVNTLEATNSVIDPNGTTHSGELADINDVSVIQSSSDVTVTDTQPGTVSDGEFLKNSGGSLTGRTVQTEPNEPNYNEDENSPFSASLNKDESVTFNLNDSYDIIKVHGEIAGTGGAITPFKLRPNAFGAAANYTVEREDASTSVNNQEVAFATVPGGDSYHFTFEMAGRFDGRWWIDFGLIASDEVNPVSHAFFSGSGLGSPITSIEFIAGADQGEIACNVYGVEVSDV